MSWSCAFYEREFHADTVRLFDAIAAGDYEAYTSEYVTFDVPRWRCLIDEYDA